MTTPASQYEAQVQQVCCRQQPDIKIMDVSSTQQAGTFMVKTSTRLHNSSCGESILLVEMLYHE